MRVIVWGLFTWFGKDRMKQKSEWTTKDRGWGLPDVRAVRDRMDHQGDCLAFC